MTQSAENMFTSRSERTQKKRSSLLSAQRCQTLRRVFGKEETAAVSFHPPSPGSPAAYSGIPTLAVSNPGVSTVAETRYFDNTGLVEDSQVLATAGTSLALELSGCQQIDFEVMDDSPGLLYTAPDGSKKWTPAVVNHDGHESEYPFCPV